MVAVTATRMSSSAMPLAARRLGSSAMRTAGKAPPPMLTWPMPCTCAKLCASTVEAASYICPRESESDVSDRIMMGASAGFTLR